MDYRDLENLGQQMSQKIRDAVDSLDFENLNREIRRNADDVISGVKHSFDYDQGPGGHRRKFRWTGTNTGPGSGSQSGPGAGPRGYRAENWQTYRRVRPWDWWNQRDRSNTGSFDQGSTAAGDGSQSASVSRRPRAKAEYKPVDYGFPVERCPRGEVSGTLLTVFGAIGFTFSMCGTIGAALAAFTATWAAATLSLGALGVFDLVFVVMMAAGTLMRNRVKRFRRYIQYMKGKSFATFKSLASLIGKKERYVVRDVSHMLELGYFPQGHIDTHKTCLMVTDVIYEQYLETMENASQRQKNGQAGEQEAASKDAKDQEKIRELEELGRKYMEIIRKANDDIPDTEISNKLYRMEAIIGKIFDHVKKYPKKADRLSQFQNYYMPMTIKLVETYRDLDQQTIQGENIKKVKEEIAGTLDTINEAYEKLYDSMYQETAMDVASDISVLRTLLAREGLTKGAFDKKEKK
ncbi:MAG TPA: 5-bromo-4-chloroindolyl phosphate hydrolysis family protein [Candidatus Scybalocola faecigallinarum]|uniref:5-bromo-4-chloroindolyl phosphate hydrolysis family protein n=1 Tax=Candidatus Scybalocola faecigallinarum TaxID=2840941 RepID=A0A9D1F756_9FIRM|nr:5-bromo-4-chloroindolyl phosphate hydrolysis family protein [Candidatus Scybalocola faecigallinarum]